MSGFLTTGLLWLLYYKAKDRLQERTQWNFSSATKKLFTISIALVAVQIFLGAWTSTNYASYSCTDFPLCQGQILPDANFKQGFDFFQSIGSNYLGGQMDHDSRVAIHLTHRFGAIVVTLVLIVHELSSLHKKISNISPRACRIFNTSGFTWYLKCYFCLTITSCSRT